ncbi:response regulator transcription factor [Nitrospirillum sp. BR 11163]|uniref:response regulator transcription factor n=1 Tax=Nitrospirillum sp. BR 11163 TaxID=3104323 RepID=UPI002AFF7E42|nr:response regulator [Nitrospirillum sp. BR 11163]MEA1676871.1 response regulator [Nitrospirillum sp. BR 11163]
MMKDDPKSAKALISIVEDDPSLQTALVRLVRSLGYNARGFLSAEDFLAADVMADCSCVITDVQMPGMNGIDLAGVITRHNNAVPVIVITARPDNDLEQAARAQGAACFLKKPVDTQQLVRCLERALAE